MRLNIILIFINIATIGCVTPNQRSTYNTEQENIYKSFNQKACENGSANACHLWANEEHNKSNHKVAWEATQVACYSGHDLSCELESKFQTNLKKHKEDCLDKDGKACIAAADLYFRIGEIDSTIYYLDEACLMNTDKACDLKIEFETLRDQKNQQNRYVRQQQHSNITNQKRTNFNNGLLMLHQMFNKPQIRQPAKQKVKCTTRPIHNINGRFIRYDSTCE